MLLDGVDLHLLSDEDLRSAVVAVTQESFLFDGTVAWNIGLGRPDASRAEVEAAAKAIGAHEFIAALPEGYDTDVPSAAAACRRVSVSWCRSPARSSPTRAC